MVRPRLQFQAWDTLIPYLDLFIVHRYLYFRNSALTAPHNEPLFYMIQYVHAIAQAGAQYRLGCHGLCYERREAMHIALEARIPRLVKVRSRERMRLCRNRLAVLRMPAKVQLSCDDMLM